jgi:RNA polymerase sigma factor (sigma-70 family)
MSTKIDRDAESAAAIVAYKNGDRKAGELLLSMHDGLITICAKRGGRRLDLEDAKQEASIWFLDCVKHFDPSNGARFSTYAFACLPRRVKRYAENTATAIRVPVGAQHKAYYESEGKLYDMVSAASRVTSLDAPIRSDEPDYTLHDVLADASKTPDKRIEDEDRSEKRERYVASILAALPERQRSMIVGYYLEGLTLREIGERMGCHRENVRQIIVRSMAQLKRKAHV